MPSPRPILHLASITNDRFFPGLAVAFASAINSASGKYDYHLHLIDDGLPPERLPAVRQAWESIAATRGIQLFVSLVPFEAEHYEGLPPLRDSFATYVKLLLPQLFPDLDTIRFIDADLLCCAGVEGLCAEEGSHLVAGISDSVMAPGRDPLPGTTMTAAEKQNPYINGGVLWMNLKRLREERTFENALDIARTHQPKTHDQTLINHLCRGRIATLPDSLNLLLTRHTSGRIAQEWTTLNVHYIGPNKPWAATDPTTKEFFSFSLWHAAAQAFLPGLLPEARSLPLPQPPDLTLIRVKAVLYTLINPLRGAWYRRCLASCVHWKQFLQTPAAPFKMLNDSSEAA